MNIKYLMTQTMLVSAVSLFISGCAVGPDLTTISSSDIKPVTYDYSIPGASKEQLFKRARDHFATVYGDSRSVIRVEDEKEGLILGKGAVDWNLATGSPVIPYMSCVASYNIRFLAKDAKARLQIELIEGAPAFSQCSGWPLPTITAYKEILASFDGTSEGVKTALNGLGEESTFKDF
ncbi:DUF4468 domain-containing protein [Aeromonas caviae]|jgi:hypothetical protein|uniref:DUF4468 domain-containing protein n=1 Tax=Aeromonas caviae TaxID=648 RepID=UPI0023936E24|nr:DUF4468 domain-containing protein [Aeromonas hydrophila]